MDERSASVLHLREAQKAMIGKAIIPITMIECMEQGELFLQQVSDVVKWAREQGQAPGLYPLSDVKLLAPIPRPRKKCDVHREKNYSEHVIEMGGKEDIPEYPLFLRKLPQLSLVRMSSYTVIRISPMS
ncbi:hypothetical protein GCM10020331_080150 [Ectobacillus funiculus]